MSQTTVAVSVLSGRALKLARVPLQPCDDETSIRHGRPHGSGALGHNPSQSHPHARAEQASLAVKKDETHPVAWQTHQIQEQNGSVS